MSRSTRSAVSGPNVDARISVVVDAVDRVGRAELGREVRHRLGHLGDDLGVDVAQHLRTDVLVEAEQEGRDLLHAGDRSRPLAHRDLA
jgi:hypothetical protein